MTAIRKRICLFSVQFNRLQCVIRGNEVEKHDRFKRKHTNTLSFPFHVPIHTLYNHIIRNSFDRIHIPAQCTYSSLVSFSRNPFANGLLTIFSWVTCNRKMKFFFSKLFLTEIKLNKNRMLTVISWKNNLSIYRRKGHRSGCRILDYIWLIVIFKFKALIVGLNLMLDRRIKSINQANACHYVGCFFEIDLKIVCALMYVVVKSGNPPNIFHWEMKHADHISVLIC